jgi:cytidylate kinase
MAHLTKTILTAGEKGRAVIIGRGAHLILPAEKCFRVRVIAPVESRLQRLCEWTGIERAEAERIISEYDQQREEFIRENFGQSDGDPLLYDLVVNTAEIFLETAADVVVQGVEGRFPDAFRVLGLDNRERGVMARIEL